MNPMENLQTVAELSPSLVWQIFAGISDVPRPSKHEERIRKHVRDWAASKSLTCREDAVGNLLIEVPASKGHENAPTIVLQAHLDMVHEKNAGTTHDFDNDPIQLQIVEDQTTGRKIVRANGTTLGADNGMGVAMAMATAIDSEVTHGPLELLFTLDEEDGMTGAKALKPDFLKGRTLLNLDTEEDDTIYVGCAGGCDTNISLPFTTGDRDSGSNDEIMVKVAGLRGGHSGTEIHENRGSAIKLLTRTLLCCSAGGIQVSDVRGGSKRNAIPREASALVTGPAGSLDALRTAADQVRTQALTESNEANLVISVERHECDKTHSWLSPEDTQRLLACLAALPQGVLGMSPAVPGLVQTSNNVSTVGCRRDGSATVVEIGTLSRSSNASCLDNTCEQIAAIARLAGGSVETGNEYPGWEPDLDSKVLGVARRVYEDIFDEAPKVEAVHAGLECGIIGRRIPGMDMTSIGPTINGAHSPDEVTYVDSVEKSWRYLVAMLDALTRA